MNTAENPALVLNADFRPLSYYPLSLCSWQDAIKAVFLERVSVIENYEHEVHSPNLTFKLPSVIALKDYVTPQRRPAFTRFNVFLKTPIFISHGAQDAVLPISNYNESIEVLKKYNYNYENYLIESDEHTMSQETITFFQNFIKKNI